MLKEFLEDKMVQTIMYEVELEVVEVKGENVWVKDYYFDCIKPFNEESLKEELLNNLNILVESPNSVLAGEYRGYIEYLKNM